MELEKTVANLVEQVEHRFYGKYRGFVVNNADPKHLGRLTLRVPSVLGPEVVTGWAMPCLPYGGDKNQGFLFIPEKEAGVWVEFEAGDPEFPIWTGTFWSQPGGESELPRPNAADGKEAEAEQHPPTRKIIKTKAGHTIQMEDKDEAEMVIIVQRNVKEEKQNVITMDNKGITITDGANNNSITMNDQGITITDGVNDNSITMGASRIELNGGKRICLEGLIEWLGTHKHMGNMGAPTPLDPDSLAQFNLEKDTKFRSDKVTAK